VGIREGVNLEAVILDILGKQTREVTESEMPIAPRFQAPVGPFASAVLRPRHGLPFVGAGAGTSPGRRAQMPSIIPYVLASSGSM
jgi:hypothetical protein